MNDATGTTARARIEGATPDRVAGRGCAGPSTVFVATGTVITDPGFLAVYREDEDENEDGRGERRSDQDVRLPRLVAGERRRLRRASRSRTTPPSRPRATPRLRSFGVSRSSASAGRRPTPASSGRSRTAAMSGRRDGARPVLHGLRRRRAAGGATSPTWSTTASPPRWRTTSTRSPRAARSRSPGSSASTSASTGRGPCSRRGSGRSLAVDGDARPQGGRHRCTSARSTPAR